VTDLLGQGEVVKGTRTATRELEPAVADRLRSCEYKIDRAYDDAWHALKEIHDDNLFKVDGYKTFKDYVEQRWGYSKTRAHQLIDHVKIVEYLKEQGVESLPTSEAHTRAITKLRRISKSEDDFLQRAGNAWEMAKDTAPKKFDVPQVTADHVESTMEHFGVYRQTRAPSSSAAATDLRALLTKIAQGDAVKMTPDAFVKRFNDRGFPNEFVKVLTWLNAAAELVGK
jgi:hypothetical protein